MTDGKPTKAELSDDQGVSVKCQFNPETMRRMKTAQWTDAHARGAHGNPPQQFVGTGPETLTVKLLFDAFDPIGRLAGSPLDPLLEKILGWLKVPDAKQGTTTPQPAVVTFGWGTGLSFKGSMKSVQIDYLMFDEAGGTRRANVTISMQSVPEKVKLQNPTSGGIIGRTAAILREGDTLASISYAQYGNPNLWRAIALANGVEDPGRVPVGTRLLVPPRNQADALSRGSADGDG